MITCIYIVLCDILILKGNGLAVSRVDENQGDVLNAHKACMP